MTQAINRRDGLRLACAALLAAALPGRGAAPDAWGALDLDWDDASRQRAVPVRLYLPESARKATPAPLVVFSHGLGGSRRGYSWFGQCFASHGIASLHLQHVGSDRQVWSGNFFSLVGRLHNAAQASEAIARVQDLRFALDTLLGGELGPRLDARRIVAAGHSYGANTALLASGARVPREGGVVDLHDSRVRAAIVISAPPFYGHAEPRKILASVTVPSLHVTATEDIIRIPGYYSGVEDRIAVFDATGGPNKWLAVFEGGAHSMFTDRSVTGGVVLDPQVRQATQTLMLAFAHAVLDSDGAALAAWPRSHAALLARFSEVRA